MLDHPTTTLGTDEYLAEVGIILVGPKAAGKSTVLTLLNDLGCHTIDVSDEVEAETTGGGLKSWQKECIETLGEMPWSGVCAVEGLDAPERVEWFSKQVERHLIVKVNAHLLNREERFVQQHLDTDPGLVSTEQVEGLREKFRSPVFDEPSEVVDHHLVIRNTSQLTTLELWNRLSGLLSALTTEFDDRDPLDEPVHAGSDSGEKMAQMPIDHIVGGN